MSRSICNSLGLAAGPLFFSMALSAGSSPAIHLHPMGDTPGVEIEIEGLEGRLSTTMPELINDETRRMVYTDTNLKKVKWTSLRNGGIASSWQEDQVASYEITAKPESGGVLITWLITNLSPETWHDSAGNLCMRSHGVPDLFDPEGARTFLRKDGQWEAVRDTRKGPGNNWYLPPGFEPLELMRPHLAHGEWKIAPFHPDEAIVAIHSKDGLWTVAQAWQKSRYLIANITPKYECSEAPPLFGEVPSGGTIRATGKIYITHASLNGLESLYRRDLRSGKIVTRIAGPR